MLRIGYYLLVAVLIFHGLIHLMGFVAYWPLAGITELPYKTTLLGERWSVGPTGMRLYSVLWLGAAVGLAAAAITLIMGLSWWYPLLLVAVALSLLSTMLDSSNAFRGAIVSLAILVLLILVFGLRMQPRPFAPFRTVTQEFAVAALPPDLPAPVARFYEAVSKDGLPVIESAVITGRGRLRFMGITFPTRLRFIHDAGQGYRHYIEATLFGLPILKGERALS